MARLSAGHGARGVKDGADGFASGARTDTVPSYFDGRIDEVGLWKRVLSASECTCLVNSGTGCLYPFGSCPDAVSAPGAGQTWREADRDARGW